eukprot:Colp12_sorted_trinity150504_noHs@35447
MALTFVEIYNSVFDDTSVDEIAQTVRVKREPSVDSVEDVQPGSVKSEEIADEESDSEQETSNSSDSKNARTSELRRRRQKKYIHRLRTQVDDLKAIVPTLNSTKKVTKAGIFSATSAFVEELKLSNAYHSKQRNFLEAKKNLMIVEDTFVERARTYSTIEIVQLTTRRLLFVCERWQDFFGLPAHEAMSPNFRLDFITVGNEYNLLQRDILTHELAKGKPAWILFINRSLDGKKMCLSSF